MRRLTDKTKILPSTPRILSRRGIRRCWLGTAAIALAGGLAGLCETPGASAKPTQNPSPSTALEAYGRRQFRDSQEQYGTLAKEKPDDARLRFNAGAAAYRQNDLTNAANWFESVLAAPDLELQQKAYYNLGNTRFRLGEALPDPQGRQRLWQEALTNFTAATKLNTADTNAAANYAFVRQKLEELEQQMPPPQQQQQQQQQKDQKDQKDKKDQNKKDQSQQQQGDNNKSKQDQKDQDNSSSGADKPQPKDSQQGQQEKDGQDSKQGESAQSGAKDDQSGQQGSDPQGKNPADAAQQAGDAGGNQQDGQKGAAVEPREGKPGEMSPAQAVQLLENQKSDEKALLLRAYGNGKEAAERAARVRKPW